MLDLQYILDNRDAVAQNCEDRGVTVDLDRLITLTDERKKLITHGDKLRHEQKQDLDYAVGFAPGRLPN